MSMGGKGHFASRGRQIEIELARVAKVSDEDRDFASPNYHSEGNRKWRNHIQFVREQLVKKGHLENHTRGFWIVSESGMKRIGASKDSVHPDPVHLKSLLDQL